MYFVLVVYESVNNSVHIKRNQKYRRMAVFFWLRNYSEKEFYDFIEQNLVTEGRSLSIA